MLAVSFHLLHSKFACIGSLWLLNPTRQQASFLSFRVHDQPAHGQLEKATWGPAGQDSAAQVTWTLGKW